jgi:hypothetical protein
MIFLIGKLILIMTLSLSSIFVMNFGSKDINKGKFGKGFLKISIASSMLFFCGFLNTVDEAVTAYDFPNNMVNWIAPFTLGMAISTLLFGVAGYFGHKRAEHYRKSQQ